MESDLIEAKFELGNPDKCMPPPSSYTYFGVSDNSAQNSPNNGNDAASSVICCLDDTIKSLEIVEIVDLCSDSGSNANNQMEQPQKIKKKRGRRKMKFPKSNLMPTQPSAIETRVVGKDAAPEVQESAKKCLSPWAQKFMKPRTILPSVAPLEIIASDEFIQEFGRSYRKRIEIGVIKEVDDSIEDKPVSEISASSGENMEFGVSSDEDIEAMVPDWKRSVLVMNLPFVHCTNDHVRAIFGHGKPDIIEKIEIHKDWKDRNRTTGSATVTYCSLEGAQHSMALSGMMINGHKLELVPCLKPVRTPSKVGPARYFIDDRKKKDSLYKRDKKMCVQCFCAGHKEFECRTPAKLAKCGVCAKLGHKFSNCPLISMCEICFSKDHQGFSCPEKNNKLYIVCNYCGTKGCIKNHTKTESDEICAMELPEEGRKEEERNVQGITSRQNEYKMLQKNKQLKAPDPSLSCMKCGEYGHFGINCTLIDELVIQTQSISTEPRSAIVQRSQHIYEHHRIHRRQSFPTRLTSNTLDFGQERPIYRSDRRYDMFRNYADTQGQRNDFSIYRQGVNSVGYNLRNGRNVRPRKDHYF